MPIHIPQSLILEIGLNPSFIAKFTLFIALLLVGTLGIGKLCKHFFRLPIIAGQIVGGIVLGPSLFNITQWGIFGAPIELLDHTSNQLFIFLSSDIFLLFVIILSSAITVSYLLWIAGYETDIRDMLKVGVTATSAGIFGALMPIFMVGGLAYLMFGSNALISSIGLGLIFSATSVSIPVAMLVSQQKMHLRTSKATLGAAIVDDIFAIILLSLFMIIVPLGILGKPVALSSIHTMAFGESLLRMIVAFVVLFVVGYLVLPRISRWLHRIRYVHLIAPFAFVVMLFYFSFAELFGGLAGITGAYFAGLFHRNGDVKHRAERTLSPFINSILLPLFLCTIGLQVNIGILRLLDWVWVIGLLVIAIISKLGGVYLATELSNLSGRRTGKKWTKIESYIFGSSMVARGEVGLVVSTILRGTQIVSDSMYVIAVVVIVLTTIATPIMLSVGFSMQDQKVIKPKEDDEEEVKLGDFSVIGNKQMFDIVGGLLDRKYHGGTTVHMSEGCRILDLEGRRVRVILSPEEGIIVRGNKENMNEILQLIYEGLKQELANIPSDPHSSI